MPPNTFFHPESNYISLPVCSWYDQSHDCVDADTEIQDSYNITLEEYINEVDYESDIGNYTSDSSEYETDIDDDWTTV